MHVRGRMSMEQRLRCDASLNASPQRRARVHSDSAPLLHSMSLLSTPNHDLHPAHGHGVQPCFSTEGGTATRSTLTPVDEISTDAVAATPPLERKLPLRSLSSTRPRSDRSFKLHTSRWKGRKEGGRRRMQTLTSDGYDGDAHMSLCVVRADITDTIALTQSPHSTRLRIAPRPLNSSAQWLITMLNYMPLNGFALEPAAVTLPPAAPAQRTSTSAGGPGGVSWALATELRHIQERPAFFEGAFTQQQQQQQQYQATPASNATSTPYYSAYTPSPLAQGQTPLPAYTSTPVASSSFAPASGSSGVTFVPFLERDDKNEVFAFQSMFCRPEWADRSPEEVRLEDYAAAGVVPPLPATFAPGPVDMGLQMPQLQQQQSQTQTQQSVFGQSVFTQQQPSSTGGLFGTASVGLFPTVAQQQPPQSTLSVFGASPFQQAQQPQQQQSFFGQPAAPQSVFTSAFGSPQQPQQQQSIPQWGTATAGFGIPAGWGAPSSPNVWGSNNLFAQSQFQQQQPSAFSPSFGSPFGQQQQPFQQQLPSAFGFPPLQQLQSAFGFPGSNGCDQIPQSASFFWLDSSEHCFEQWLRTLPPAISTVSFGGVNVALPTLEQCMAQREQEKERIAKCDADPYGLHLIQSGQIAAPEPLLAQPELEAQQSGGGGSGGGGSTPASPLRRGSSSPGLQPSPARAPLIPNNGHGSTLHPPAPGTPGQHGRSVSLSASLHHSPRLGPLPESPYVDNGATGALLAGATSSPLLSSRSLHGSAPERQRSAHLASSLHGHAPLHPAPSSVLFGSQQDASHHSPSRPLRTTHDVQARTSRELQWAARLVE